MLFRALYMRGGKPRGITFAAKSAEAAVQFADRWVTGLTKYDRTIQLLTVGFEKQLKGPADALLKQGKLL